MRNGRKGGGKKKEEKRTQKGSESYAAHPNAALSISHVASDMVLLQASSGVGPNARMRCWTYFLELRLWQRLLRTVNE
jgi:hypothetical protein